MHHIIVSYFILQRYIIFHYGTLHDSRVSHILLTFSLHYAIFCLRYEQEKIMITFPVSTTLTNNNQR
jgi:hypothetical protein